MMQPCAPIRAGRVAIAALLALASLAAPAQTTPRKATGSYRIAGRVVNASTGEPVPRATVSALAEEDNHIVQSVQADAEGRFSLVRMAAGKYPLNASKRGYRTAFYDEHDDFNSAIVTGEGQDTENLVFKLTPGAVLRGVVTGDGGDPVEGANVMLYQRQHASGRVVQVEGTTTDDTGTYEFSNLAAGEYLLAVNAWPWYAMHGQGNGARRDESGERAALDVAYPITYFDSTSDEASASSIVLAGGSRDEADINLHAVPALHLKVATPFKRGGGIARPELRQTVFGVQISAVSAGFLDSLKTGTVEFDGVAPGHYELSQGDPPRIASLDATANLDVDPGAGTPAVSVAGSLRAIGGGTLPDEANLILEPLDGSRGQPLMQIAHKGQFRFDAVAPGVWGLSVYSGGPVLPVVAISAGGAITAGNQFAVRDRPLTVEASVSLAKTRVLGFARRDSKGVAGAMIVLVPKEPRAYQALVRRDQSDSDGSFSLRDVPAGRYTVVAIEDGWKLEWELRDVIARYLPGGVAVTISEGSGAIVYLTDPVPVQAH